MGEGKDIRRQGEKEEQAIEDEAGKDREEARTPEKQVKIRDKMVKREIE